MCHENSQTNRLRPRELCGTIAAHNGLVSRCAPRAIRRHFGPVQTEPGLMRTHLAGLFYVGQSTSPDSIHNAPGRLEERSGKRWRKFSSARRPVMGDEDHAANGYRRIRLRRCNVQWLPLLRAVQVGWAFSCHTSSRFNERHRHEDMSRSNAGAKRLTDSYTGLTFREHEDSLQRGLCALLLPSSLPRSTLLSDHERLSCSHK